MTHSAESGHAAEQGHGVGHVPSVGLLVGVLLALLVLTVVTVAAAQVDLGFLNIWLALAIAAVKASLVCIFFMHLRWDRPFNSILLVGALFLMALFLSLCMMDTREYKPYIVDTFVDPRGDPTDDWRNEQYLETPAAAGEHNAGGSHGNEPDPERPK